MFCVLLLVVLARFSTALFDAELHEKYQRLPRDHFIEHFNSQNYSWKLTEYPKDHIRSHGCVLTDDIPTNLTIKRHHPSVYDQLPENFDARQNWPNCGTIQDIYDQGDCESCWAFGTATVASDRMCIKNSLNVRLSEQDFDCLQPVCSPGKPESSFPYWQNEGLVSLDCKPYDIDTASECTRQCKNPSMDYQNDKHYAEKIYQVSSDENQIKSELYMNGPIFASMVIFSDFKEHYTSGIYEHKFGESCGGHGVRVIGYGTEDGVDYWLVANTWGYRWGENGLFRIKRYQSEIGFENRMYAGIPRN